MANHTLQEYIEMGDTEVPFNEGLFFGLCREFHQRGGCIATTDGLGCRSCPVSCAGDRRDLFYEIGEGRDRDCNAGQAMSDLKIALEYLQDEFVHSPFDDDSALNEERGNDNRMFLFWDHLFRYSECGSNIEVMYRLNPILEIHSHLRERFYYLLGRKSVDQNDISYWI